ncbi:hypothetical protein MAPG_03408 [Magnaporthiopsis poae ATCC 64411]|uniref:Uncharacterized protein n=1 Tax=Magnaporthiopsis poae (strain ATCC 64411 / 73-15) TaxID=644358 RepID=A0A0C4DTX9_MAGP6|nr:hypothetical protein MAPG_03408 [Magnaporthiopsis poae ATCC 64411]
MPPKKGGKKRSTVLLPRTQPTGYVAAEMDTMKSANSTEPGLWAGGLGNLGGRWDHIKDKAYKLSTSRPRPQPHQDECVCAHGRHQPVERAGV